LIFSIRLPVALLALLALTASVALGACGAGDGAGNPDSELTPEQARAPLPEGSPPALVAIRDEANELLEGGRDAYEQRLDELRGTPVVVNKWASWCGPCRLEFPYFQALAAERGDEIAFLGIDGNDSEDSARQFLGELPLPYPSYLDPDLEIADTLDGPSKAFPATAFYDRSGELVHTKFGDYKSADELAADVDRYTGAG
jgi:cytochrome c biogenesis protein CcmG/thiol:disulfide interchange protein DsbE